MEVAVASGLNLPPVEEARRHEQQLAFSRSPTTRIFRLLFFCVNVLMFDFSNIAPTCSRKQ